MRLEFSSQPIEKKFMLWLSGLQFAAEIEILQIANVLQCFELEQLARPFLYNLGKVVFEVLGSNPGYYR